MLRHKRKRIVVDKLTVAVELRGDDDDALIEARGHVTPVGPIVQAEDLHLLMDLCAKYYGILLAFLQQVADAHPVVAIVTVLVSVKVLLCLKIAFLDASLIQEVREEEVQARVGLFDLMERSRRSSLSVMTLSKPAWRMEVFSMRTMSAFGPNMVTSKKCW